MGKNQNEPTDEGFKISSAIDPAATLLNAMGAATWPFLRIGMGRQGLGWPGPFALLIMFVYIGLGECPEMVLYIPVWLCAVIVQRIFSDRRQHSRYRGYHALTRLITGVRSEGKGKILESLLVILAGVGVFQVAQSLGVFIAASGGCLFVTEVMEGIVARNRARRMHDMRIMQREMVEDYRFGRW